MASTKPWGGIDSSTKKWWIKPETSTTLTCNAAAHLKPNTCLFPRKSTNDTIIAEIKRRYSCNLYEMGWNLSEAGKNKTKLDFRRAEHFIYLRLAKRKRRTGKIWAQGLQATQTNKTDILPVPSRASLVDKRFVTWLNMPSTSRFKLIAVYPRLTFQKKIRIRQLDKKYITIKWILLGNCVSHKTTRDHLGQCPVQHLKMLARQRNNLVGRYKLFRTLQTSLLFMIIWIFQLLLRTWNSLFNLSYSFQSQLSSVVKKNT